MTKVLGILTVAGFAVPALAYFAFVHHYALNVPVNDQWSDVLLVEKAFSGHLSLGDLWAQHNENRILVPNLIVLLLAYTTHLDIITEDYLSAVLLAGSVFLIVRTHRRRSPATPLIWYCPVAILMFSWAQYENTLWGFQLAWYVVLICLAGTLAVLDREQVHSPMLGHRRGNRSGWQLLVASGSDHLAGWSSPPAVPASPGQNARSMGDHGRDDRRFVLLQLQLRLAPTR